MRRLLSSATSAVQRAAAPGSGLPPVPRRRHPLPVRAPPPLPGAPLAPRGKFVDRRPGAPGGGGVLRRLDPTAAALARELAELPTASAVLAHHSEGMEDFDLVAAATALGRVAGGGAPAASRTGLAAPWKREALPAAAVDTLARHSVALLRTALRGASDAALEAAAEGGGGGGGGGKAAGAALAPRTLAHTLHSLSRLGRLPSSLLHEVSYALVNRGLCGGPQALEPPDVAQLAFAFSRANVRAPTLFSRIEAAMLGRAEGAAGAARSGSSSSSSAARPLDAYRDAELVGILHSFSSLRVSAPELFQAAAARLCARKDQRDTITPAILSTAALALVRAMDVPAAPANARSVRRAALAAQQQQQQQQQQALLGAAPSAPAPAPAAAPPPSPTATALTTLQALAPRVEATARRFRVPIVQPHAFSPQGLAVAAWAYARAARRGADEAAAAAARAPRGAAPAAAQPLRLRLDSTVGVLAALNSAFLHPQTLATAQPLHLAMLLQATADVHELVQEGGSGSGGSGSASSGSGSTSSASAVTAAALLRRLDTPALCAGVARACVRLLDPASGGVQAGEGAALEKSLARRVLRPVAPPSAASLQLPEAAGGGGGGSGGAVAVAGGARPAVAGDLEGDVEALEELLAQAAAEGVSGGAEIVGDSVIGVRRSGRGGVGGGEEEEEQAGGRASAGRRFSPLLFQRGVALATPFAMHDCASLADSVARVGYTCSGSSSSSSALSEFWGKLAQRVCRGQEGGGGGGGGGSSSSSNPRHARALLAEDGLDSLSSRDAARLAQGFALAAPPQHAARVLAALAAQFCAQDVNFVGSEEGAPATSSALAAARAPLLPAALASSSSSTAAAAAASDTIPSFDEEPTWAEGEEEALRRSASFRRAPSYPVHRLRGEATPGSRDLRESGGRAEPAGAAYDAATGEVNLTALQAPKVHTGTRASWAARLLFKASAEDHTRLAVALALAFPGSGSGAGGAGGAQQAQALQRHVPSHWAMVGGPLWQPPPQTGAAAAGAAAATSGSGSQQLTKRLCAGLPLPSSAQPAVAHLLRSLCARLGVVAGRAGEIGRAADVLPLLCSRDYSARAQGAGPRALGAGPQAQAQAQAQGAPWPPEALARPAAQALAARLAPLQARQAPPLLLPLGAAAGSAAGAGATPAAAPAAPRPPPRAPLPLPLAACAALARPCALIVQRSLARAAARRTTLAGALADCKHARAALLLLAGAALARKGGGGGGGGAPRDSGRAAAVQALGGSVLAALAQLQGLEGLAASGGGSSSSAGCRQELAALQQARAQLSAAFAGGGE